MAELGPYDMAYYKAYVWFVWKIDHQKLRSESTKRTFQLFGNLVYNFF